MKIKNDFVTNSSSSSFVVLWPMKIKKIEDVSKYIYKLTHAEIIFRDAKNQRSLILTEHNERIIKKITEELKSGYFENYDYKYSQKFAEREGITENDTYHNHQWSQIYYDETEILRNREARRMAEAFLVGREKSYVYFFNYGDEGGGIYSELEHQNNWGNQACLRISHH